MSETLPPSSELPPSSPPAPPFQQVSPAASAIPEWVVQLGLARGEVVRRTDAWVFSLTHFFLHTKVVLTDRRLAWQRPNTILGVIPVGTQKDNFPLHQISSVSTSMKVSVWSIIIGGLLTLIGLGGLANNGGFGAVIVILVGLLILINAFRGVVLITTPGRTYPLYLAPTVRSSADQFAREINTVLAERLENR